MDNKAPVLSIGEPQNNATVNTSFVYVDAAASDNSAGFGSLPFGNAAPPVIEPGQAVAQITGTHSGLVFGENQVTATAVDAVGNSTSTIVNVVRSGGANWSGAVKVAGPNCGGPVDWQVTVWGTPGLSATLSYKEPLSTPSQQTFSIGSSGSVVQPYTGTDIGEHLFAVQVKVPSTGEIVLNENDSASIGTCQSDPTFVGDPGYPPSPNGGSGGQALLAFSPQSSMGVKDTFEKEYAAVYPQSLVWVSVYSSTGSLVHQLVGQDGSPAVLSTGLYSLSWDGRNSGGVYQPEGTYQIRVDQVEASVPAHSHSETLLVEIDNSTPTLTLSHLQASTFSPHVYSVWGNISDKNIESYTVYKVEGSTVTPPSYRQRHGFRGAGFPGSR